MGMIVLFSCKCKAAGYWLLATGCWLLAKAFGTWYLVFCAKRHTKIAGAKYQVPNTQC
jgi:hypothetical protein